MRDTALSSPEAGGSARYSSRRFALSRVLCVRRAPARLSHAHKD
ncbi:unnamed protein product [Ixodes persulcatus]